MRNQVKNIAALAAEWPVSAKIAALASVIAMNVTSTAKTCPKCPDTRLVVRTNKNTGHDFLGCANWPECDYTEPLPLDMEMRRQGAPVLPGFE